jgi:hypothetical protein
MPEFKRGITMSTKHSFNHLAQVYNHTESNKLSLMLYHKVLSSLLTGKKVGNGIRYSCFISKNELLSVDPEFGNLNNFVQDKQYQLKVEKLLDEMFEEEFVVSLRGYYFYDKFIADGIAIGYTSKD